MALRKPLICKQHQKRFVRFDGPGGHFSWGCPDCVEAIRIDVQKLINPPEEHWLDRIKGTKS